MNTRPEILLHPNIPKPLHGLNPRIIKGQDWWDVQRRAAYAKHGYHCWACGIHKSQAKYHRWLEGHECYSFDYYNGVLQLIEITALCHSCHNYIHSGRLQMMWSKGEVSNRKYRHILEHGTKVLAPVDQFKNPFIINSEHRAEWSDWHIVIDGLSYYSRFEDFEAWERYYTRK